MDWIKAKKIIVLMLIILNLFLLGLNVQNRKSYSLSPSQEKAIFDVLNKNNIGIYTDLVEKYPPMRQITVRSSSLNSNDLTSAFFSDSEKVSMTTEFSKTIYRSQSKTLTLENNMILFENQNGEGAIPNLTRDAALEKADSFLSGLTILPKSFLLESVTPIAGGYEFYYNEIFHDYKIFSNYCKITVTEKGVVSAEINRYEAEGFTGDKRELAAPDEILLTFLYELKKQEQYSGVIINSFELGYDFQEKADIAEGSRPRLVPCYRIFIDGSDTPYIINAYTNEIKKD